jgi:hypothetical protein
VHQYVTNRVVFIGLALLCPLTVLFPYLFITNAQIETVLRMADFENTTPAATEVNKKVPVVILLLDELPLVSILDAQGGIDRKRFPNFAAFASDGT